MITRSFARGQISGRGVLWRPARRDEDDDVDEGAEIEWEPPTFHMGKRKK